LPLHLQEQLQEQVQQQEQGRSRQALVRSTG
jgi:hypothetical protein